MSTMDAERALRVQTIEVPRIKATAARKGSILFAEGKGKPYVVDPVAIKVCQFVDLSFSAICNPKSSTKLSKLKL